MKIGELFVALGFKVDSEPLDQTEKRMEAAAIKAGKLALVVNAVNAAMLAMVNSAMESAVSLRLWEQTTGGAADQLQRWANAARIAGIDAKDLKSAVVALQDARNAFALGEPQNVGAWSILGVDPTQDPFVVLSNLRARMAGMKDPNLMRGLLGKVGLSGVMPLLQASDADFAGLQRAVTSPQQVDALVRLNREWQRLLVNVGALKNQLAAVLAPALGFLAKVLGMVASGLTIVTNWLTSNNAVARVLAVALGVLAVGMLGLGAALAVVTAALAALAAALLFVETVSAPVLAAFGAVAGTVLLLGVLIAALVLIVDDLITAMQGGESVSGIFADWLISFDLVYKAIEKIWWVWDKLVAAFKAGGRAVEFLLGGSDGKGWAWGPFGQAWRGTDDDIARRNRENMGGGWFTPSAIAARQSAGITQDNKIQIMIDGAQSPEATANATARSVRKELEAAAYQMPVPNH